MKSASILIKPASSSCNINCTYCFYQCLSSNRDQYSFGFMSEETLETLVKQAIDYADEYLTFAFQGGEPTLAGLPFYEKAIDLQKKYNKKGLIIENTIQTNGILLDKKWAEFLAKHHFLVGLSLDGPKKLHDLYRKDQKGNDTFSTVMNVTKLLNQYHVDYNIVSVITNESCEKASYLYKFYKRNHFPYVQLIPCMDEQERNGSGNGSGNSNGNDSENNSENGNRNSKKEAAQSYAINPERYGHFLNELFDLWYNDFTNGEIMDIRMFSNLAQLSAGYPAEECGMNGHCNCYFVVEGNGNVYPCDFYCMDKWNLGTVTDGFENLYKTEKARQFIQDSLPDQPECTNCEYFSLCRGGCRRWREDNTSQSLGLNILCPAYKIFFEHCSERIEKLGKLILERYGSFQGE